MSVRPLGTAQGFPKPLTDQMYAKEYAIVYHLHHVSSAGSSTSIRSFDTSPSPSFSTSFFSPLDPVVLPFRRRVSPSPAPVSRVVVGFIGAVGVLGTLGVADARRDLGDGLK